MDHASAARRRYWRSNLFTVACLLSLWAVLSLLCSVLCVEQLNAWQLGGFPLGFWFAQQGSILGFVLLILAYAVVLGRLDARLRRELAQMPREDQR
jgi:putative solute:sodium symporter small subunit